MTDTSEGAAPQRPPHAIAVPQGRQRTRHQNGQYALELHPDDVRQHAYYYPPRQRRRWPIGLLFLAGAAVFVTEIVAPGGFKPMTIAGGAVGGFTSGVLTPVNEQELCKEQAKG